MGVTADEREWMRQALALASRGRGWVEPNPMVGCLIVREGRVLGMGYHQRYGEAHAEPNALQSCQESPAGATAIVTLEPCCHTKKKTPPCVPALLAAGVRRVVIGHVDPNPAVSGGGVRQLQKAGVEVVAGVEEPLCRQLNAPFFSLMQHGRPYVTLKWAQSADGLVGGCGRTPRRISGEKSSQLVHALRTRCDAIAVSVETVLADDPMLSVRGVEVIRRPIRVVLDRQLKLPLESHLARSAREVPVHVFTSADNRDKAAALAEMGVAVHRVGEVRGHLDFPELLHVLGEMRLTHLLVEPGPRLAHGLFEAGLADRVWVIRSPKPLDEIDAPLAPPIPFAATASRRIGEDEIAESLNPASPVYFTAAPSPELSLPE